jgi:hypothetical protein
MRDLSLSERVDIVNTVGFTRLFFLDRFIPASRESLDSIREMTMSVLRQRARSLVSYDRLTLTPAKGGFGLRDLPLVLRGPRAELWRRFLLDPGHDPLALYPLCQMLHHLAPRVVPVPRNPFTGARLHAWSWQWQAILYPYDEDYAVLRLLPGAWDEYRDACWPFSPCPPLHDTGRC